MASMAAFWAAVPGREISSATAPEGSAPAVSPAASSGGATERRRIQPRRSNEATRERLKPSRIRSRNSRPWPWAARWVSSCRWRAVGPAPGSAKGSGGDSPSSTRMICPLPGSGARLGRWPSQPGGRALFRQRNRVVWVSQATASIRERQRASTAALWNTASTGWATLPWSSGGIPWPNPTTSPVWSRPWSRTRTRSPRPALRPAGLE